MRETTALIAQGESETVEFKERWSDREVLRELAAFANSQGGVLLVGVSDTGTIVGWEGRGRDLDLLTNKITDSLRLHPSTLRREEVGAQAVLRIDVRAAATP